jgi:uncharacterized glyoxalase superfamily protein PhnB
MTALQLLPIGLLLLVAAPCPRTRETHLAFPKTHVRRVYLEVDGLDELFAAVKDRVEIVLDLRTTFYGMREAWIRDCNGYVLTLAEAAEAQ